MAKIDLTLPELKALKRQYILQGEEVFARLSLITAVFGAPIKIRHRDYCVWQRGNITALYSVVMGVYMPKEGRYQETQVLSIFLNANGLPGLNNSDRIQVCYLKSGDQVNDEEQLFVPGKWLNIMLADYDAAVSEYMAQEKEIVESKRAALIKELLIGIQI